MHHGITSHRSEPMSPCLQSTSSNDADQQGTPKVDITQFGWEVKGGILSPCFDTGLPAPQGLIDVINCGCKSEGKACSTESYNCQKKRVIMIHCLLCMLTDCSAADGCCNPYTVRDDVHKNGDEQADNKSE